MGGVCNEEKVVYIHVIINSGRNILFLKQIESGHKGYYLPATKRDDGVVVRGEASLRSKTHHSGLKRI